MSASNPVNDEHSQTYVPDISEKFDDHATLGHGMSKSEKY